MPLNITMPQLGESLAEGTVGKWLKRTGDSIARDEPLVEIITDKVTAEMHPPAEPSMTPPIKAPASAADPATSVLGNIQASTASEHDHDFGRRASPLVRRLAQEHDVDV